MSNSKQGRGNWTPFLRRLEFRLGVSDFLNGRDIPSDLQRHFAINKIKPQKGDSPIYAEKAYEWGRLYAAQTGRHISYSTPRCSKAELTAMRKALSF